MSSLPTGTVTFLFTDIEGSTHLAQAYPEALPGMLERHHAILRQAMESHHGYIFQIIGDAFCVAFPTTLDAVQAALHAQRGLKNEPWTPVPIWVRMGIHTGIAQATEADNAQGSYAGYTTLARAQRVMSTAHGGQILLSNASAELVRSELPPGVSLLNMREHRLKGLLGLERLWQVAAADLRRDFPPLRTLDDIPNNLPIQLTSFVGRVQEMADAIALLGSTRLLTLMGPGGTGKTRLALRLSTELLTEFKDGVWFIELAPLADPELVPQAVAGVLGVREEANRAAQAMLSSYLADKNLLLVLDNCEHLVEACARFADLILRAAPTIKLLATSREALDVAGESVYYVHSMTSPEGTTILPEGLLRYDAVKLFVDRAIAAQSDFVLTRANSAAVAQVCRRLDGIPLAIELAAARLKAFSPEQIAARLDDRFRLLSKGSRTAVPRHQTLTALIQWSYDLLTEAERVLLRRLSVFAGGWQLEAAEAVCGDDRAASAIPESDVLELHSLLVNKSLVVVERNAGQAARYRLLETIREYAMGRLVASGELETVRRRHMLFFWELAQNADGQLTGPLRVIWLEKLAAEEDNLRVAHQWAKDSGDALVGLQLAGALWLFWYSRGNLSERRRWLASALAASVDLHAPAERARALSAAGNLAWFQGDYDMARPLLEEAVLICRELGDAARTELAMGLLWLGAVAREDGQIDKACALLEESVAICRQQQERWTLALTLVTLGRTVAVGGDTASARPKLEEARILFRQLGDQWGQGLALNNIALVTFQDGEYSLAVERYQEAITQLWQVGERGFTVRCAEELAWVICKQGHFGRAARLFGAAEAQREAFGAFMPPAARAEHDQQVRQASDHLGEAALEATWADGRAMTIEQMVEYALSETSI